MTCETQWIPQSKKNDIQTWMQTSQKIIIQFENCFIIQVKIF